MYVFVGMCIFEFLFVCVCVSAYTLNIIIYFIKLEDGLKKNANQQLPEVDSLVCMECGCIKLSAPIVGGVSDIEIDVSLSRN